ncbi:MAG: lactate utilization protein [Agathobacter sp.]|nr:lactate utilization protein [Agathobacter sp.]
MSIKQEYYKNLSNTVLKGFQKRFIEGYYCETAAEAKELALSLVPANSKVSFGGSVTLDETGVLAELRAREDITLYDRATATTPEENKQIMHDALSCDYYFMSSNAITIDGELVNIDGNGNRVAALIYGPDNVIILAGMNKIVKNVEEGISRTRNVASPQNCVRLNKNTPCAVNGVCGNCLSDTICDQIVITRASRVPNRIKVILVGEELGF